jgi:hypothetical protein
VSQTDGSSLPSAFGAAPRAVHGPLAAAPGLLERGGAGIAALAAVIVFVNALANGFAFDDVFIIQTNARVHDLGNLRDIWLTPYWPQFGPELGLWRPLVIFGYALQWAVVGDTPWFFHLVNIVLHAAVTALVFAFIRRLGATCTAAFVAALVFAVHPVHTEVVANIVGQAELIAAATTLGACIIHGTRPAGAALSWPRRLWLLLLFGAGVLAKESAIVLPAVLVALDVFQRRVVLERASVAAYLRGMSMPLFLFAAAAVLYFAIRIDVLGSVGGVDAAPNLPFLRQEHRVLVAFRAWVEYTRLLAFPADLSADYSPGVILPVEAATPLVVLGATLLAATAALALATPWAPRTGLPAAWLLITALPASNLIVPIGVVVAERLLYTPSVALALALAFAWDRLAPAASPGARRAALAALALAIALMGVRTWIRNPDWRSTESILQATLRDHPESYRAQWVNATDMFRAGNRGLGYRYLEIAHRIWPHDSQLLNEIAFEMLGRARFDSAAAHLERSRAITSFVPRTHMLLAEAYIGEGRYREALEATLDAARLGVRPDRLMPLFAQAYEGLGRHPEASGAWRAAIDAVGQEAWPYWARLARARALAGDPARAVAALDTARARLQPQDTTAARILATLDRQVRAGCYQPGQPTAGATCEDPMAEWRLLATLPVVRLAPGQAPAAP